jgi:hypothetical protein
MPLIVESFGPFVNGVSQGRNPSLDGTGFLRHARHVVYSGTGKLSVGGGSAVAITLMDDAGSPAEVTSVCEVVQFGDGVLAVGHSTATDDCYLYRLDSGLTGWYNLAGAFTASSTATPLATVLWSSMTDSPVVHIAEMLGQARITCTNAQDAATLNFPTRIFTGTAINNETADLDGTGGAETLYATGCVSFQAHSWIWGFGSGTVVANTFRPELLRFGGPNGGALDASGNGSIAVGHRVRSNLERVVTAVVAGDVMYVGTTHSVWPIVGYGRDSWDKSKPLDDSYGFIGPKSQVAVNGVLYYWSPRGPMRVSGLSQPEPLWDMVPDAVLDVTDPEKMVAAFNRDVDQVQWFYRGTGATANRMVCAFDTRRDLFVGPDRDVGILVGAANWVVPVVAANATPAAGPSGPPTTAVTSAVTALAATASWTNGDATAQTVIEVRPQSGGSYTAVGTVAAGVATIGITGLANGTAYEWRATHFKNGQYSAYLGPVAGSQFTTTSTLAPPTGISLTDVGPSSFNQGWVQWTNSGESGVSTEVYLDSIYQGIAGVGESSYYVTVSATASYAAKVRHVKSGLTDSAYTSDATATLTYGFDI